MNAGRRHVERKTSQGVKGREPTRPPACGVRPALSEDELFDRCQQQITVMFGWFFLRHLHDLYHAFGGDMVMPIVLGEIAHHNICHTYSCGKKKGEGGGALDNVAKREDMEPCNALSLSDATGIPRETCRRKVRELLRRGMIRRHPKGGYVIERQIGQHFHELDRGTFSAWMKLMNDMNALLADAPP